MSYWLMYIFFVIDLIIIIYMTNMSWIYGQIEPYLTIVSNGFTKFLFVLEQTFLYWTSQINFPLFCIIYAIFLIYLLRKLNKKQNFRPENKQLIGWKQYYKNKFMIWILNKPFIHRYIRKKLQQEFDKMDHQLSADIQKNRDAKKSNKLPQTGMTEENLKKRINQWTSKQMKNISTGKISGALYIYDQEYYKRLNDFAAKYMYHNPLHLDTYKQLMKMESEVLKMTSSLISKNPQKNAFGIITSGGSQSLIMSLYAYRKYYSDRKKPNIVVPNTVHAAVDKGAHYFNIQVRKAKITQTFQVDVKHMESLIDQNTILIIGSYPNYPHGIVDPIQKLAKLGKKYNIGVHIDGCLGGFVAAFDKDSQQTFNIDRDGITSMSIDHHKFALAPKGISTIFFKTRQLRQSMYYINTQWCGGLYATPSFCGSRHGFSSAGAWYAITEITKKGYQINSKLIIQKTKLAIKNLKQVNGVTIFGNPRICAFAFNTQQISCFDVAAYLTKIKHYQISPIHKPNGIHVSMTLANCEMMANQLYKDVSQAIQYLKKNPATKSSVTAFYGASSKLPNLQVGDQMIRKLISITLK